MSNNTYIDQIIEETRASKEMVKTFCNNNIYYVVMNHGDNKYSWEFSRKMEQAYLSILESEEDLSYSAVVTLSAHPKIWSNGLDLGAFKDPEDLGDFLKFLGEGLAKLITSPIPTIALLNGHCYAAGLCNALSHDYVIMRSDRGYI